MCGRDAALRSTRTLETHSREAEWHQESKIGTASKGSARVNARPGLSASEALSRPLVRALSLSIVASSFRVTARARSFVHSQSCVPTAEARGFGSSVRARGALSILLPPPRLVPWPVALAQRLRLGCALTTRWSESAAGGFGRGKGMLQFRIKWLRSAAEMPRFAQRGR